MCVYDYALHEYVYIQMHVFSGSIRILVVLLKGE